MLSKYDTLAEPTVSVRGLDSFQSGDKKITGTEHLHTIFLTILVFTFSGKTHCKRPWSHDPNR